MDILLVEEWLPVVSLTHQRIPKTMLFGGTLCLVASLRCIVPNGLQLCLLCFHTWLYMTGYSRIPSAESAGMIP